MHIDPFRVSPTLFRVALWRTPAGAFLPAASVSDPAGLKPIYRDDLIGRPLLVVDNTRGAAR